MKWVKIFISIFIFICLLGGICLYWFVLRGLPSVNDLTRLEPTELSKVIGADGTTIAYFPPDGRIIVDDKKIPDTLKRAFIAAEDATFYEHAGLDTKRIFSALIKDIRAASYVQGASTITQQVVRSYLLTRKKTIARKLKEAILSLRIEKKLTKDQILNLYLNRIYLGSGAYGVDAAALRYFDKHCWELDLSEISLIAGLAPAPSRYSPLNNFNAAKRRQWYVLSRMVQEGYISDLEAADAYQSPLKITGRPVMLFTKYPYATDYIRSKIIDMYGEDVFSKGITINTTIVPSLQDVARQAIKKGVILLEMRQGNYRGPLRGSTDMQKSRLFSFQANQLAWQGFEPYNLYWAEIIEVSPLVVNMNGRHIKLGPDSYAWIKPKGSWSTEEVFRPGDLVQLCYTPNGFVISQEPLVQAALIAFDIEHSGVIAMIGGVDFTKSQFNRASYAYRQSGSAIKPFIYSAAIDKGLTPASIIVDTPITYESDEDKEKWRPKNYEDKFYGPTSLRTGLVLSRNVVTVKILRMIGLGYAIDYLKKFDISSTFPRDLSLALGSASTTLFNLSKAYACFATYGFKFEPHIIESIIQRKTGPIFVARTVLYQEEISDVPASNTKEAKRSISEQTSYIITNILSDVIKRGTGWRARILGRPVAGKTGTSDDNRDAWFIGYTPGFLCGVWVGYDDMLPLGEGETGSRAACPIFVDFMKSLLKDKPVKDFRVPEGIVFARVDAKTGRLATSFAKEVRFECFKQGMLPPKSEPSSEGLLLKEVY